MRATSWKHFIIDYYQTKQTRPCQSLNEYSRVETRHSLITALGWLFGLEGHEELGVDAAKSRHFS